MQWRRSGYVVGRDGATGELPRARLKLLHQVLESLAIGPIQGPCERVERRDELRDGVSHVSHGQCDAQSSVCRSPTDKNSAVDRQVLFALVQVGSEATS